MKIIFEPNDTVMYGGQGACTLLEVCEKDFSGAAKLYYVLRPAFSGSSVFYVPVDSEALTAKMRAPKSAAEIYAAIKDSIVSDWIEDDRPRQNYFKGIVDGGGTEDLLSAFKSIVERQTALVAEGKKLRAADERFLHEIERLLFEEFSFVFEIEKGDITPFILGEKELNAK